MNITKLFEAQAKLDAHIAEQHPVKDGEDRFAKKIVALLVEFGELANEWRGFKFWSNDQEPRSFGKCKQCLGKGEGYFSGNVYTAKKETCMECNGTGKDGNVNPLLEEYVDCLHFIISIGLDLKVGSTELFAAPHAESISSEMFTSIVNDIVTLDLIRTISHYQYTFTRITELGLALGFTPNDIEQAYYSKNEINHQRQESNY